MVQAVFDKVKGASQAVVASEGLGLRRGDGQDLVMADVTSETTVARGVRYGDCSTY